MLLLSPLNARTMVPCLILAQLCLCFNPIIHSILIFIICSLGRLITKCAPKISSIFQSSSLISQIRRNSCADPEGGKQGVQTPPPPHLKKHKNIGFLSNTGLNPLKITKLPSQHSMLEPSTARQGNAI